MAEGQPSSRRILLGDASSGVGGWLLGQGICLSDYHNNSYARLAFVFGTALIAMPQVSPIYRAMAESIPAAWKGRLQNTAPYAGVVIQIVAITLGVVLAIRIYKLPQPQETVSQYQWNALNAAQKTDLNTVIRRLPKRRVLVIRPDTPDCAVLADSIADVLQQQSELLAPPYSLAAPPSPFILSMRFGVGFADSGVQIYAPQNPDDTVKALQAGLSKVLNYPVGIGLISPELYGNLDPDLVVSIGPRKTVGFLVSGDEQIQAGARSATIKISGISSYSVTASTSWGANAEITETKPDHFVVEFSSPAPLPPPRPTSTVTPSTPASATPAATSTITPFTGQLHWLAFHYP